MKLIPEFENFKIAPPRPDDDDPSRTTIGQGNPKNWRAYVEGIVFAQGVSRDELIDNMRIRCTNIAVELDEYETWLHTEYPPRAGN